MPKLEQKKQQMLNRLKFGSWSKMLVGQLGERNNEKKFVLASNPIGPAHKHLIN